MADSKKETIQRAYIDACIVNDELLVDHETFCQNADVLEGDVLQYFENIEELQGSIWTDWMTSTLTSLATDEQFETFSGREQLLAFYYTHLSVLQPYRAYIQLQGISILAPVLVPYYLESYKSEFLSFASGLLAYGSQTGEIADRWILNNQYDKGLWSQLLFFLQFWIRDDSQDQEKTDAVIEKAVDLSYELVRPSLVDSAFDFAKFMVQNWRNK